MYTEGFPYKGCIYTHSVICIYFSCVQCYRIATTELKIITPLIVAHLKIVIARREKKLLRGIFKIWIFENNYCAVFSKSGFWKIIIARLKIIIDPP